MKKLVSKLLLLLGAFVLLGSGSAAARDVYLLGSFNNGTNSEDYKFSPYNANEYTLTVTLNAGNYSGIAVYDSDGSRTDIKGEYDQVAALNVNGGIQIIAPDGAGTSGGNINLYVPQRAEITFRYYIKYDYNWNTRSALKVDKYYTNVNNVGWSMRGNFDGGNEWKDIPFESKGNNKWIAKGKLIKNGKADFGVKRTFNGNEDKWYANNKDSRLSLNNNSTLQFWESDGNPQLDLDNNGTYTFIWDSNTKKLTVCPSEMYIYGYLNNRCWETDNYETLVQDPTNPWIYKADYIDVSGRWSAEDAKDPNKKENESTGDENYIAIFDHLITDMSNQGNKYSSDAGENLTITSDTKSADMLFQAQNMTSNFKPKEGIYHMEINLLDMTINFAKQTKKNVAFTWMTGDTKSEEDKNQTVSKITETKEEDGISGAHYSFSYGDTNPDIVQVGIGSDPGHRVARQVEYKVEYKAPVSKAGIAPRISALADNSYGEAIGDTPEAPNENAHYTQIGNSDYGTNNVIQLNKAGEYRITASQASQDMLANDVKNAYNPLSDAVLYVTLDQADVAATTTSLSQAFNNTDETITIDFGLNNTQITSEDLSATFVPANGASGWPTEVTEENIGANLFAQYKNLSDISTQKRIDGAYDTEYSPVVSSITESDNQFTATVTAPPCSGMYQLIVTSTNSNFSLNETYNVAIYPNLFNEYSMSFQNSTDSGVNVETVGFNLNGVKATGSGFEGTISYPEIDGKLYMEDYLAYSHLYTPGLYLADLKVYSENIPNPSGVSLAAETTLNSEYWDYNSDDVIDFSNLTEVTDQNPLRLYVYAEKNGAATPVLNGNSEYVFTITTGGDQIPTGVEAIGAEESGEAVYYNLQGVRVLNPENGIYVKVQGGKTQKVVKR